MIVRGSYLFGASVGHNIRTGGPLIERVSRAHRGRRSRLREPVPLLALAQWTPHTRRFWVRYFGMGVWQDTCAQVTDVLEALCAGESMPPSPLSSTEGELSICGLANCKAERFYGMCTLAGAG